MRLLFFSLLLTFFGTPSAWLTNMDEAKTEAKTANKLILLNFSGSDWCAPCIRMKTEVFDNEAFVTYADANLVLLNADFARSKKKRGSEKQVKLNEKLAEKYNPTGQFPFTLLLDSTGQVLRTWEGFPKGGATQFVADLEVK